MLEAELALRTLTEMDPVAAAQAQVEAAQGAPELDDARREPQKLKQPNIAYYLVEVERARTALTTAEEGVRLAEMGPTAQVLAAAQARLAAAATMLRDATNSQAQCPNCVEVCAGGQMRSLRRAGRIRRSPARR